MFFTMPTLLTWTRIVAIPLIVGVFYLRLAPADAEPDRHGAVHRRSPLTDWLDGYLARS